ncbi:sensor histidine kinase [Shouchella lonarensis]|uniref:histidine kinase n=1 Tax=Shouchella lonarensis TaxID=1464122 RepID=A0A1G6KMD9_9BACI|nr:HAMP domain-containing sensor histidine kinase [Shouchella lonarensis]SDC32133.1 hypothetical protein SAMN05421737_10780 [Shouchella lonarensis]
MSQSVISITDDILSEMNEQPSLFSFIQVLRLPYVKVDEHNRCVHWSDSFLDIVDLAHVDLQNKTMVQLANKTEVLRCINHVLAEARQLYIASRGQYDQDETLINVTVMPEWEREQVVYYILLEDLSGQRKFEQLLLFYDQMENVSRISASVAHEIRNPLSMIRGIFQLAQRTNNVDKYAKTVISEIDRTNLLLEEFVSLSRRKRSKSWQSPLLLIESFTGVMQSECTLCGVAFKAVLSRSYAVCYIDETILKQVMLNLLRRAMETYDHTRVNGFLHIKMDLIGEWVNIEMIDNGGDLSQQTLKPKRNMSLCKKMIEENGGTLLIRSEMNIGTKVTIQFPVLV